ncbi:hypothetical protein N7468_003026 [Penicillium chermesinum]|uniref:Uncharacterized protein n=1 Tax=Penicillium chermesinum TaxID=63820 RepID=A0A9W9P8I4_9EURO|nr:uncharacterized protein N7468_003026 [Penicillium chermesinum]KAJ5238407.1 hypothetical protein N7468_003026 [Penicillium chermesinum]
MLSTTSAQTVLSSSENEKLFLNEKVVESPSQPKTLTAKSPSSVLGYIAREVDITCRLLRSNAVGFLFIFLGASVSRIIRHPLSWSENVLAVIESFVLTIPGAYVFDICNQTSSLRRTM